MGEIDQVGRRLKGREGDNEAWFTEWHALAEDMELQGEGGARGGPYAHRRHLLPARRRLFSLRRALHSPERRKFASYRRCMHCFEEGFRSRYPAIERVEVPYEGKQLPAFFMKAPGTGRKPTVVCFDGLDLCKEMSILFAGVELSSRGINTLAIDGPGQGEALRLRGLPSRYDYEVPGTAAYDYVAARADVDPKRVGIMAFSMGGYYAPRIAAFEKRYAACAAWGARLDYHGCRTAQAHRGRRQERFLRVFQLPWVMGAPDMDSAMER
jgi:hypothetical protein